MEMIPGVRYVGYRVAFLPCSGSVPARLAGSPVFAIALAIANREVSLLSYGVYPILCDWDPLATWRMEYDKKPTSTNTTNSAGALKKAGILNHRRYELSK